ncbi:MAG: TorF family putative porin [Campylobacterales bacterium]
MKKLLVAAAVAGSAFTFTALAEGDSLSANVSATTNYVWRGQSQTDNGFAVQGGVDYAHASGAYVGLWASNVDSDGDMEFEYDFYAGYAGEAGEIGYDIGLIQYMYTYDDANAMELMLSGSYQNYGAAYYHTLSADDTTAEGDGYLELTADFEKVAEMMNVGVRAGYSLPDSGDSETDFAVTGSKDDFEFAPGHEFGLTLSNSSVKGDTAETQIFAYWAKSFDF